MCASALHPLPGQSRGAWGVPDNPPGWWRGFWGDQPKELLSWSCYPGTALKSQKSSCLSPVSVTTVLLPLTWDTETILRFLLTHHWGAPKGPSKQA